MMRQGGRERGVEEEGREGGRRGGRLAGRTYDLQSTATAPDSNIMVSSRFRDSMITEYGGSNLW